MIASRLAALAVILGLGASCSSDADPRRTPPESRGIDESFIDADADPCTDFYRFACGNWLSEHAPEPGYVQARFGNGDGRIRTYFDLLLGRDLDTDVDLVAARAYHDACIQTRGGEREDFTPTNELTATVAKLVTKEDLPMVLAALHGAGVRAFFHADPSSDFEEPTRRMIWLSDGGESLPTAESYLDAASLAEPYRTHMRALSALFPKVALDPSVVWDVERRIAAASPAPTVLRDPTRIFNPTETSALAAAAPSFSWLSYFRVRNFGEPSRVNVVAPEFLAALEEILAGTPIENLRQYLTWRVLESYAYSTSAKTIHEEVDFHETIVLGRTTARSDDFACLLGTRALFGTSLARAFVARFVHDDEVRAASKLVEGIRKSLRTRIEGTTWLDGAARGAALDKLDAIDAKIGFPEVWNSSNEPPLSPGTSFTQSSLDAARFASKRASELLSSMVDGSEWTVSPDTTNAFYSPTANALTLPVAILGDPFFSADWTDASNYGALGSIIGHEMTHGFDDQGRHFDAAGKLTDWWSGTTDAEFRSRAECLVKEFDAFAPLPDRRIDGALTLGENIADLGGLKLSYDAFVTSGKRVSPVASFDPDQAFFVSYAQLWCRTESPDALARQLESDPHAPAEYRVNGVVRNVPDFARAFHCPKGAELAPADRCDVW